ncbi:MAG: polysaccharide biosynthesis/export family protein [Cyanobacteria bacterium J06623_4]
MGVQLGTLLLVPVAVMAQDLPVLTPPLADSPAVVPVEPLPASSTPTDGAAPQVPAAEQPVPVPNNNMRPVSTVSPPPIVPRDYAASSYILGAGDRIELDVYGFEEYTGSLVVLPDGTITLPLVGKIPAAGRTTDQLEQELTVALDRVLVTPYVSVTLSELRPIVINVSGEVHRPGPISLQGPAGVDRDINNPDRNPNSFRNRRTSGPPSVSEALIQAGGVMQTADIRDVVVMRSLPNGQTVRTNVNLWDSLWSETLPDDMLLRDGDLVFVPRLAAGDTLDTRLLARSTLSPDVIRVRVVGEVTNPGEVPVPPNSSLSSAVAIAGGPTEDAKLSEVAFVRMNDGGEIEQEVVDLSNLVDNYQVQDGDVVVVPKSTTTSVLDFAARLLSPLNFLFGIF